VIVHSFHCLPYDIFLASSTASSLNRRSSASSFNFQHPLVSLSSCSSCLRLFRWLLVTSIFPPVFPSATCCGRQFLSKMEPIQSAFLLLIVQVCRTCLSFLTLCNGPIDILHLLRRHISKLFPVFLFYFPKFQQHTQLHSKCNTLLVSSLNLNPIRSPACLFFLTKEGGNVVVFPSAFHIAVQQPFKPTCSFFYVFLTVHHSIDFSKIPT